MNFKEYTEKAKRTSANLSTNQLNNIHYSFGLVTEAAEIADVFKKNLAYNKPVDWVNLKEEIGDLMWYLANFCRVNDFDIEEIMNTNIAKLEARYPEKFTEENAINRNLEREREILEQ